MVVGEKFQELEQHNKKEIGIKQIFILIPVLPLINCIILHLKVLISCPGQMAPLVGELSLYTKKVAGLIPDQGTFLGGGFIPWLGYIWEATDFVSVSH